MLIDMLDYYSRSYWRNGDGAVLPLWKVQRIFFTLASPVLRNRYGEIVSCYRGFTQDRLSEIVINMGNIDFVFHDAAHSREDYIRDLNIVSSGLASGSVVLLDDIR